MDQSVNGCMLLAVQAQGHDIETIEARVNTLHKVGKN